MISSSRSSSACCTCRQSLVLLLLSLLLLLLLLSLTFARFEEGVGDERKACVDFFRNFTSSSLTTTPAAEGCALQRSRFGLEIGFLRMGSAGSESVSIVVCGVVWCVASRCVDPTGVPSSCFGACWIPRLCRCVVPEAALCVFVGVFVFVFALLAQNSRTNPFTLACGVRNFVVP